MAGACSTRHTARLRAEIAAHQGPVFEQRVRAVDRRHTTWPVERIEAHAEHAQAVLIVEVLRMRVDVCRADVRDLGGEGQIIDELIGGHLPTSSRLRRGEVVHPTGRDVTRVEEMLVRIDRVFDEHQIGRFL